MKATIQSMMYEVGAMLLRGEDDHAPDAFLAAMIEGTLERYTMVQRRNGLTYMLHHETMVPLFQRLMGTHPTTIKVLSRAYCCAWMHKLDMGDDADRFMALDLATLPEVR